MRLLDARTMTLETFRSEYEVPRYAILSHTWDLEEVTFDDLNGSDPSHLQGYGKIKEACRQTCRDGIHYLWVDTCCIDKRSSAELSETINSMFKWYQAATVCYAYLQDVEDPNIETFKQLSSDLNLTSEQEAQIQQSPFAKSRWWTRGWTLQELIAPSELIFYDKAFGRMGSKEELVRVISLVSGIDEAVLLHKTSLTDVCVATKMSWAAQRKTTRIEDMAYSLLGIFGIYMAMLYGEGDRAFIRLQEEIIKSTNDQSIFAWN
ncbi:HET-domain-containing protein, partial [Lepidopterella palustris CBS 459.81]